MDAAVVLVVSPKDSKQLLCRPEVKGVEFFVANDIEEFKSYGRLKEALGVLIIPPGNVNVLDQLWELIKDKAKWVHSFFAGVDSLAAFTKKHLLNNSIPLTNGRGAFSSSLAEYAMTTILHFNKQIPRIMANTQDAKWDKFVMDTVKGKTMGLVGFGDIARACARLAKAFGMKVIALRRSPEKGTQGLADKVVGFASRMEVFSSADFVVSVLPGTEETKNFCGEKEFSAMKSSAVFINIGRGVTVDEDALHKVLKEKKILGAALDVFWKEPLPKESPLWGLENILITAHNADFTTDYAELGWKVWVENYNALVEGKPMATPVQKAAGY